MIYGMKTKGNDSAVEFASIPLQWVGPLRMSGPEVEGLVEIPLATFESPLWPSVAAGADVTCDRANGQIHPAWP